MSLRRSWILVLLAVAAGAGAALWLASGVEAESAGPSPRAVARTASPTDDILPSPYDELRQAVARNQRQLEILKQRLRVRGATSLGQEEAVEVPLAP